MIKEIIMYTVACDNCCEEYEHEEFRAFTDPDRMAEDATSYGNWAEDNGKHYCPKCHHMDDEGNLVIDKSRKKE